MAQRRVDRVPLLSLHRRTSARHRPRRTALLAVAVLGAAVLTGLTAAAASPAAAAMPPEGPTGNAFYTPPSPLPPGRPGDVIWQRKTTESATSTTYLVLYRSTNATGQPMAVSGQVIAPKLTIPARTPIVGVAPGTTGLGDQCAVSRDPVLGAVMVPGDLVQRGFALAVTDYEGLGTPGRHTYVVGRSEGRAVIDVVRAATRLGVGLSSNSPVGFWGYSQGGGGAMWAGELAPTYGPELRVRGIAAGGVPADLIAVADFLDGGIAFGFMAAAAAGFDAAYPELDLEKYLNAEGRAMMASADTKCAVEIIAQGAFKRIGAYTTTNPMQQPDWQARLRENSLGARPPKAPVFMWHSLFDEVIPFAQADALRQKYCKAGVRTTWSVQVGEHVTGFVSATPQATAFMTDRLRGLPAPSNC
jgi:hypothetical protein